MFALTALCVLAWGPGAGELHDARVGVVSPEVVSDLLMPEVGSNGLQPVAVETRAEAEGLIHDGELVAAVVVDLARTEDVLLVDRSRSSELVEAVRREVETIEHTYGRTLTVRDVTRDGTAGEALWIDWVASAVALAGFLIGLTVVAVRRSRRDRTPSPRRALLALLPTAALVGALGATVLAFGNYPGDWWNSTAALALLAFISASLPVIFARSSGTDGVAIAAVVGLLTLAPLLLHVDHLLLPQPWRAVWPYLPSGAAREALEGSLFWRPLWVSAAWIVAGTVAVVVIIRRQRVSAIERWRRELPLIDAITAAAPVTVLLLGALALLPTDARRDATGEVMATTKECVGVGEISSVKDLNLITGQLRGSEAFAGGDVGADVLLQDGRRLWLFGDTVRTHGTSTTIVRNSMLVLDDSCISAVVPASQGALIPNREDGVGYWPMSVASAERPGYDLVTVAVQRVHSTGSGAWDFEVLGPSLAVFVVPRGGTPQLMGVRDIGPDENSVERPMWGAASHVDDDWLYLYGTATDSMSFGHSLRVARVRPDQVMRPRRWTYWDGSSWSTSEDDAVELIDSAEGTSQTLSVWEQDGTWYALSKRHDLIGDEVVVWTAPAPTGPFTAQPPLAHLPSDFESGELRYMPLAHPDLLPEPGTVVISWSNNRSDVDEIIENPYEYRPRFKRVELP